MLETNWPWKLTPISQTKLNEKTQVIRLKAGSTIYREGETSDMIFRLVKGRVKVYKLAASGNEIALFYIAPGQVCPLALQSCLLWKPIMATAVTMEDSEIACVPAAEFAQMLTSETSVTNEVLDFISQSLKSLSTALKSMSAAAYSKKVQ